MRIIQLMINMKLTVYTSNIRGANRAGPNAGRAGPGPGQFLKFRAGPARLAGMGRA